MEVYILIIALVFMIISKMNFLRRFRFSIHPIVYFLISVFLFGLVGGILLGKHVLKEDEEEVKETKKLHQPKKNIINKSINNGYTTNIFDSRANQDVVQAQRQTTSLPQTMQYL